MPDLKPWAGTCTGLEESSAPAPRVEIYSTEPDAVWILTTQCPITPKGHRVRTAFQLQTGTEVVEDGKTRCPLILGWSEKSRDSHPSGRAAWAIRVAGLIKSEPERQIPVRRKIGTDNGWVQASVYFLLVMEG